MNACRLWLGLAAMACLAVTVVAAPAPAPESQGPISDALRLRETLPKTVPPVARRVVLSDENNLEVERVTSRYVIEENFEKIEKDGKEFTVKRSVTQMISIVYREQVAVKNCKFSTVTKEGKLESIEPNKATALLKKPTIILTGDSAEVDPRHLEMVKPGTLYLVLPGTQTVNMVSPEKQPIEKPRD